MNITSIYGITTLYISNIGSRLCVMIWFLTKSTTIQSHNDVNTYKHIMMLMSVSVNIVRVSTQTCVWSAFIIPLNIFSNISFNLWNIQLNGLGWKLNVSNNNVFYHFRISWRVHRYFPNENVKICTNQMKNQKTESWFFVSM